MAAFSTKGGAGHSRPAPASKRAVRTALAALVSATLLIGLWAQPAHAGDRHSGRNGGHHDGWSGGHKGHDGHKGRQVDCDPGNGGITLPDGFCATVFADGVGRARHLTVSDRGDVYVALLPSMDGSDPGGIVALRDTDRDGHADRQERFGDEGGNGIDYRNGFLYFAPNDGVVRYDLRRSDLVPDGPPVTLVEGLPEDGDHQVKTVVVGDRGRMYVNIASATNSCQVENRTLESPGLDPCPELEVRAGVWEFSSRRAGQQQSDGTHFAIGARNMNAMDVHPRTGELFGVQNGRDQLFENWPALYDEEDDLVLPAEELFHLQRGQDYGWPYCYFDPQLGHKVLAPEYGGDTQTEGPRCEGATDPLVTFPAHWAPLGMHFYEGDQFPREYRNGAFVANHGSRFAPALQPEGPGYNVTFVPFRRGMPTGDWSIFADGFAAGETDLPAAAPHRALDVAEDRHGSIYISDDVGGRIWKVSYTGDQHDRDDDHGGKHHGKGGPHGWDDRGQRSGYHGGHHRGRR